MQTIKSTLNLEIIKAVAEMQYNVYNELGETVDSMITFNFEHATIVNPFLDESGIYEVEPVEYYGEAFLNSNWIQFVK